MGSVYEATFSNVVWHDDSVTATASVGGLGSFSFEAKLDAATRELHGRLYLPGSAEVDMRLEGKCVN